MSSEQQSTRVMPAIGQMQDPLMVDWALDRLAQARDTGEEAACGELEALFDERTLRKCLEEPGGLRICRLLMNLPAQAFVPVGNLLLERWPTFRDGAAHWAAPVLAAITPERFLLVLESDLQSPGSTWTSDKVRGAIKAATVIGEPARGLASALLVRICDGDGDPCLPLTGMLTAMLVNTGSPEPERLLTRLLSTDKEVPPLDLDSAFAGAHGAFYPSQVYLACFGEQEEHLQQPLLLVPELFRHGAPLLELDRLRGASTPADLDAALDLLPRECGASAFAFRLANAAGHQLPPARTRQFVAFVLGLASAAYARDSYDVGGLPLPDLMRLTSADLSHLPCGDEIARRLRAMPRSEVVVSLVSVLRRCAWGFGAVHAARIMGELRYPEFVDPLVQALGEDSGDCLAEAAERALGRMGRPAGEALLARWSALDGSQKIYGMGVLERLAEESLAPGFAKLCAEQCKDLDDLDQWCQAAQSMPHPALVEQVRKILPRGQACIDETYVVLSTLLGGDDPRLPCLRERVLARERAFEHRMQMIERGADEDLVEPTIELALKCRRCGEENLQTVDRVFLRPGRDEPPLFPLETVCPSCGVGNDLLLSGRGEVRLAAELKRMMKLRERGAGYIGPLRVAAPASSRGAAALKRKVGRNDPCPCGSGKKHKKCCGR